MPNVQKGNHWLAWVGKLLRYSRVQATRRAPFISAVTNVGMFVSNVVLVVIVIGQYQHQKTSEHRVWRAQQITLIYEMECSEELGKNKSKLKCLPKNNIRLREEAVRAYAAIDGHGGNVRLAGAVLSEMPLTDIDLSNADLSKAKLQGANLSRAELEDTTLVGADLRGATLRRANLAHADLTFANLRGANLLKADLRYARLEKTVLGVCSRSKTDMGTGETYTGPLPKGANMKDAKLKGAVFRGALLCGVDFTGATGLSQEAFESAMGDELTKLPAYVKVPEHWAKIGERRR